MPQFNNQSDSIDNRFFDQNIKVPRVIGQQIVQEFGDVTIPAPAGVVMDPTTGLLEVPVFLIPVAEPQIRVVQVFPGKVINQGVVPVSLCANGVVLIKLLEIPFQGVVEVSEALPGDIVQKHDIKVEGFSIAPVQLLETDTNLLVLNLILKVVLRTCIIVARESVMKVNAAETFC
ncbi:MAG: hypothetical protein ACYDDN_01965 [Candidatus Desulforudaceae bacterium]|jgi:hypothetical protein